MRSELGVSSYDRFPCTFVELTCLLQTCYDTLDLTVAPAAAPYLKQLGAQLAPSASFNFTLQVTESFPPRSISIQPYQCSRILLTVILTIFPLQVFSSVQLCCSILEQSLVLSVMADLLANATNLITLRINSVISYGSIMSERHPNSANFSFTASSSTYSPVPSLSMVCFLLMAHVQCFCMCHVILTLDETLAACHCKAASQQCDLRICCATFMHALAIDHQQVFWNAGASDHYPQWHQFSVHSANGR